MSELILRLHEKLPQWKSVTWAKKNLFNSIFNTILTISIGLLVLNILSSVVSWFFLDATFQGDAKLCRESGGACWAFIFEKSRYIIFGHYPTALVWRPALFIFGVISLFGASFKREFWGKRLFWSWILWLTFSILLLDGRLLGLTHVETTKWGGLPLTLLISFIGIGCSYPFGIILAVARQSNLIVLKTLSVLFIELIRGVPLISILFMASVLFPIFLPDGFTIDKLFRAQVAIILFSGAYMAEVIRGGLQAIPRGQVEAAKSIGLTNSQTLRLVVLPQALRIVIPPTVSTFIGMFKDTSLLVIIALFDLMFTTKSSLSDSEWLGFAREAYIFTAMIYFVCCFSMSRLSKKIEESMPSDGKKGKGVSYGF